MSALLLFSVVCALAGAPIQEAAAPPPASAARTTPLPQPTAPPGAAEDHIPMSHGDEPGTLSGRPHGKPLGLLHRAPSPPPPPPPKEADPPPPQPR